MGLSGFPLIRYITDDFEAVLRAIKLTDPGYPLDLIVHTPAVPVLGGRIPGVMTVKDCRS